MFSADAWIEHLSHPLVLLGFVFFVFAYIVRSALGNPAIRKLALIFYFASVLILIIGILRTQSPSAGIPIPAPPDSSTAKVPDAGNTPSEGGDVINHGDNGIVVKGERNSVTVIRNTEPDVPGGPK